MKHLNIIVKGRVQNVGFRFRTMEAAYKYGVAGIVMNQDDNSVYIEAEGDDEALEKFVEWCNASHLGAKVEQFDVTEGPMKGYTSFEIKSRGRR